MKTCPQCERTFEPKRPHARYCSDRCRAIDWRENHGEEPGERVQAHPLAEVRAEAEEKKAKAHWTLIARQHIERTLLETGYFNSEDFDALGIPAEHVNVGNSWMGHFSKKGYMEPISWRPSSKPSRKGGKIWIYRITRKGRQELLARIGAGGLPNPRLVPTIASADPGEQTAHREGTPQSKEAARSPIPVPSADSQSGGSGVSSQVPEPPHELQRGRDCQVRGAGSPSAGRNQAQAEAEAANATRRMAETQPARLFTPPPMSAITNQEAA